MVEGVVDSGMDGEKTLGGSSRLEPLHLALSSPHDLMGVFSAIIFSEASEHWSISRLSMRARTRERQVFPREGRKSQRRRRADTDPLLK